MTCTFLCAVGRFLRDGYRTPKEDNARLYYERWELRMFENIECEWPLFYSYLILFHLFQGDKVAVSQYAQKLEASLSIFILYNKQTHKHCFCLSRKCWSAPMTVCT